MAESQTPVTLTWIEAEASGGSSSVAAELVLVGLVVLVVVVVITMIVRSRPRSSATPVSVPEGSYRVTTMGHETVPFDGEQLQELRRSGQVQPHTQVSFNGGHWFPASEVPGLFGGAGGVAAPGEKSFTAAVVLSVLVGVLGVDRFYLGYTGLGILKLVTFGGCGIWSLVDLILIATGRLNAADGSTLRR